MHSKSDSADSAEPAKPARSLSAGEPVRHPRRELDHARQNRPSQTRSALATTPRALPVLEPIRARDAGLFARALAGLREPVADTSFISSLCWAEPLELSRAVIDGHLCVFSDADGDRTMVLPPLALEPGIDDRLGGVIETCFALMDAVNANGVGAHHSRIEYVSDETLDRIRAAAPHLSLSAAPMPGDYIYDRHALSELAGGDLKNKRKLRSRFLREHPDVTTHPITPADVAECVELLGRWRRAADARHEGEANEALIGVDVLRERDERFTIAALHQIEALGLPSMAVRSGGKLVGFTIAEVATPTMAVVCVEKTDPDAIGCPQFIFSEFCRTTLAWATEVNAGDDWGIATLRFTKQSWRPTRMLAKSVLTRGAVAEPTEPDPATVRLLTHGRPAVRQTEVDDTKVEVRAATAADADAIMSIEEAAFPDDDRFNRRQIRRLITNPRARVLVACIDGVVAGWSVALIRAHLRWRSGRVYSVAVRPELAGRGIGRALLRTALGALGAEGISRVYLEVRESNTAAIELYHSEGFAVIGRLADYYGRGETGLRMRRVAPN